MQLQLNQVIPIPLKDKFSLRSSDVWNRDLTLQKGEQVKIKAPSGTGKTTLIHILYKIRMDYSGNIFYGNENTWAITGDSLAKYRQQNISIIFQDLRLFSNLTARENIELNRVMQAPLHEAKVIDEMSDALGITSILDQRAGLCSYGEQQRIAIIRALMQPFDWLLMDEPFSHLDTENTKKAALIIQSECKKRNAGFLLTDLDEDDHFHYSKKLSL